MFARWDCLRDGEGRQTSGKKMSRVSDLIVQLGVSNIPAARHNRTEHEVLPCDCERCRRAVIS